MQLLEALDILHGVPRLDKFRAVQFLTAELAHEEAGTLQPNDEYAVWSPHDAASAAATLTQYLREQPRSDA
jgi:hypothetical protein